MTKDERSVKDFIEQLRVLLAKATWEPDHPFDPYPSRSLAAQRSAAEHQLVTLSNIQRLFDYIEQIEKECAELRGLQERNEGRLSSGLQMKLEAAERERDALRAWSARVPHETTCAANPGWRTPGPCNCVLAEVPR